MWKAKSPTKNSINTVNKIRQDLGFAVSNIQLSTYNGTTGSAAGSGNTIGFAENANNRIKKLKKMFNNFNWSKIDDLMNAYIYAIYDDRFNSIETVNKLKEKICKDLNISKQEELLIIEEYNQPEIGQIIAGLNIKNPIVAIILIGWIWWKTNSLLDKFYKRPDINITNKELDIKNDMRHIAGLAFLTKIFGADKARKLGYLKEHLDFFTHEDKNDTLIDFDNNEKGIAVAIQCPNLNMEEIIQKIYNVYIKNKRNLDKS